MDDAKSLIKEIMGRDEMLAKHKEGLTTKKSTEMALLTYSDATI